MNKKEEIYQDITKNCDIILELLKDFDAENETPEGRMIYQCRWLKEQIVENSLSLPVEDFIQTLNYITSEKSLTHLATSDDNYDKEVGKFLYQLCYLVENKLLNKPLFYLETTCLIDKLIDILRKASRKLNQFEQGLIVELDLLKKLLLDEKIKIELPLIDFLPEYPNFRKVFRLTKSTIDDLPNGKYLCQTVANLLFEGIRPDTWLTPKDAEQDIKKFE